MFSERSFVSTLETTACSFLSTYIQVYRFSRMQSQRVRRTHVGPVPSVRSALPESSVWHLMCEGLSQKRASFSVRCCLLVTGRINSTVASDHAATSIISFRDSTEWIDHKTVISIESDTYCFGRTALVLRRTRRPVNPYDERRMATLDGYGRLFLKQAVTA